MSLFVVEAESYQEMVALKFFVRAYEDWFSVWVFAHKLAFGTHKSWKSDNDAVEWMLDNDAVEWMLNVWLLGP